MSDRDRIIDALMQLTESKPWNTIELDQIADKAGLSLGALRAVFPSKGAILGAFGQRIDKIVLETPPSDEGAREKLFDIYMRRLDALAPYKQALRMIAHGVRFEPLTLAALNKVALNAQRYMLASAGIATEDTLGTLKLQGAVILFARLLETWFEDEDPDMAKTMAQLDQDLRRSENLMQGLTKASQTLTSLCSSMSSRTRRKSYESDAA